MSKKPATRRKRPSKAKQAKPKKPSEAPLEPFKIEGTLIGARYNEHGKVVMTEPMGSVELFEPNFHKVRETVDKAVKRLREQERIIEETATDESGDDV